jgi:preprotein translocase subunit SecB
MNDSVDAISVQETAARVAARANVVDVRMFQSAVELVNIPSGDAPLSWDLEVTPSAEYTDGTDYFIVKINFSVQINNNDESSAREGTQNDESEKIANIAFQMGALYSLDLAKNDSPVLESELSAYAQSSGMLTLYPYAREYVHGVTGKLGLPPLLMSVFQLPYPGKAKRGTKK